LFSFEISAPTGDRVHADIYNQGNGEYKVEWMPRMPGEIRKMSSFIRFISVVKTVSEDFYGSLLVTIMESYITSFKIGK
jgi:hypothetical protein